MEMAKLFIEFSFNDVVYQQTDGIAMGSPLGPALANNISTFLLAIMTLRFIS